MWRIPPPMQLDPVFEVSAIIPLREIGEIVARAKGHEYDV